jgi:hypothetical protein
VEYSYKIIRSDISSNVMEVEYSSAGHETLHIGMPLPVEGQSYLDIIRIYAPVHYWTRSKLAIIDAPVGETGVLIDTQSEALLGAQSAPGVDVGSVPAIDEQRIIELRAQIQVVLAEMAGSVV